MAATLIAASLPAGQTNLCRHLVTLGLSLLSARTQAGLSGSCVEQWTACRVAKYSRRLTSCCSSAAGQQQTYWASLWLQQSCISGTVTELVASL